MDWVGLGGSEDCTQVAEHGTQLSEAGSFSLALNNGVIPQEKPDCFMGLRTCISKPTELHPLNGCDLERKKKLFAQLPAVLVCSSCCNKVLQPKRLKLQKFTFSQCWRLEV